MDKNVLSKLEDLIKKLDSNNYEIILKNLKSSLKNGYKTIDKDLFSIFLKIDILDKIDSKISEIPKKGFNDRRGASNKIYLDSLNSFKEDIINLYFPFLKGYEEYSVSNNVTVLFDNLLKIIENGFGSHHLFQEKFDLFKNKVNKHYSLVEDFRFISNTCLGFYEITLKKKIKYQSQVDLNKDYIETYMKEFNNDLQTVINKDDIMGEYKLKDFLNDLNEIINELQISISQIDYLIDFFLNKDKFIGNQIIFKNPILSYTEDELKSVFKKLSEYDTNVKAIYLLSEFQYNKLIKLESTLISNGYLLKYKKKYKWLSTKSKICELCYYLTENKSFNIDTKYSTFVNFFFERYNTKITTEDLNKSKNSLKTKSIFEELLT